MIAAMAGFLIYRRWRTPGEYIGAIAPGSSSRVPGNSAYQVVPPPLKPDEDSHVLMPINPPMYENHKPDEFA